MSIYYLVGEDGDHLYNRIFNNTEALLKVLLKYPSCYGVCYDFDKNGEAVLIPGYYYLTETGILEFDDAGGGYPWDDSDSSSY
jgi:hypothetical protein